MIALTVPGFARYPASFTEYADLTAVPLIDVQADATVLTLTFAADLPPGEQAAVRARAMTPTGDDETPLLNTILLREEARASIDALLALREEARVIAGKANADVTARDTKDVARALRDAIKPVIALARLVGNSVESIDTGAE